MVLIVVGARFGGEPPDRSIGPLLRAIGVVVLLLSLLLVLWSGGALRSQNAFAAAPRPVEGGSLVRTGPYVWIRHPLYAGLVAGGLGIALWRFSLASLVCSLALFVILDLKRRREEAWLLERYPDYAAYRDETAALVPFVY